MSEPRMVIRKRVEGQVLHNDGEFAEIQTNGIEGMDEGILLATIQAHRGDTHDTPAEFQQRFPIGLWLDITTVAEIKPAFEQELCFPEGPLQ